MEPIENVRMKIVECDNLQVAASMETDSCEPHPIYYPSNVLLYMQQGQFNAQLGEQSYRVETDSFVLIRKYTHGQCYKTWGVNESGAIMVAFVLQDEFLQKMVQNVMIKSTAIATTERIIPLPYNAMLKGLMDSIWAYVKDGKPLDRTLIELKTMEALLAIAKARPDLIATFKAYSAPERADLENFMEHNFMYNIPLNQLAKMSGRSLSTFNREFKNLYQQSPHKWIKQQRLEMAKRLLIETDKMASEIYLDVGFEDLAHFSRSFKKHFGQNPSQVKQMAN